MKESMKKCRKKHRKKTDYPTKKAVNLAACDRTIGTPRRAIPMFVLYLVLLGLFVRFCVIRPIKAMADSQIRVSQKQEELLKYRKDNENYEEVKLEYDQYFCSYLTDLEREIPDRSPVLLLLKEHVTGDTGLKQVSIAGQECQAVVTGTSVSAISELAEELEASSLIQKASVSLEVTKEQVTATITMVLPGGEANAE